MPLTETDETNLRRLTDYGCRGWMVDRLTRKVHYLRGQEVLIADHPGDLVSLYLCGEWSGNVPSDPDAR